MVLAACSNGCVAWLCGVSTPRAGLIDLVAEILYKQGKFQTPCSFCLCLVFVQRQQTKHGQKEHGAIYRFEV